MATEIIGFNNSKSSGENTMLTEEMIKDKINNLTEEDEDNDGVVLDMSDLSDLAEAMALVKVGLERISAITQVDVSEEAADSIATALSQC